MQLVTPRLFNGPGGVDRHGQPSTGRGAFTDLRPRDARALAADLPACARPAESMRRETDR